MVSTSEVAGADGLGPALARRIPAHADDQGGEVGDRHRGHRRVAQAHQAVEGEDPPERRRHRHRQAGQRGGDPSEHPVDGAGGVLRPRGDRADREHQTDEAEQGGPPAGKGLVEARRDPGPAIAEHRQEALHADLHQLLRVRVVGQGAVGALRLGDRQQRDEGAPPGEALREPLVGVDLERVDLVGDHRIRAASPLGHERTQIRQGIVVGIEAHPEPVEPGRYRDPDVGRGVVVVTDDEGVDVEQDVPRGSLGCPGAVEADDLDAPGVAGDPQRDHRAHVGGVALGRHEAPRRARSVGRRLGGVRPPVASAEELVQLGVERAIGPGRLVHREVLVERGVGAASLRHLADEGEVAEHHPRLQVELVVLGELAEVDPRVARGELDEVLAAGNLDDLALALDPHVPRRVLGPAILAGAKRDRVGLGGHGPGGDEDGVLVLLQLGVAMPPGIRAQHHLVVVVGLQGGVDREDDRLAHLLARPQPPTLGELEGAERVGLVDPIVGRHRGREHDQGAEGGDDARGDDGDDHRGRAGPGRRRPGLGGARGRAQAELAGHHRPGHPVVQGHGHRATGGAAEGGLQTESLVPGVAERELDQHGIAERDRRRDHDVEQQGDRDEGSHHDPARGCHERERQGEGGEDHRALAQRQPGRALEQGRSLVALEQPAEGQGDGQHREGEPTAEQRSQHAGHGHGGARAHPGRILGCPSRERALAEVQGHAEQRGNPHPDQRSGATGGDRQGGAGDAAHARAAGQQQQGAPRVGPRAQQAAQPRREAPQLHSHGGQGEQQRDAQHQVGQPRVGEAVGGGAHVLG